ncbi:nuclease-related domain-containing protein [Streptacidiphilus griseoplanus]|uniref:nuclease-related domain-containing protein n=1 Tax=Peterkaempfera griseoplana TaxID=66896 RepID=UPI000B299D30|nr:nuclease-related domain-containing protein [Peterkaempfera griseoplana]
MDDLVVRRWRRNGQDRVYVHRAGPRGESVAYYDYRSGALRILVPAAEEAARACLDRWKREQRTPRPRPSDTPSAASGGPSPLPVPPLPPLTPDEDLAGNRPGAALVALTRDRDRQRQQLARWGARPTRDPLLPTEIQIGIAGEVFVGQALERLLPDGWRVLHAVQWPSGGDIDHLLIGPPGVITVNSKHHADTSVWVGEAEVRVDGRSTDYLRSSINEARRVAGLLLRWCGWAVPVHPVIAVVGARRIRIEAREPRVPVVDGAAVDRFVTRLPAALGAAQVDQVFDVARRRRVWLEPVSREHHR